MKDKLRISKTAKMVMVDTLILGFTFTWSICGLYPASFVLLALVLVTWIPTRDNVPEITTLESQTLASQTLEEQTKESVLGEVAVTKED